MVTSTMLARWRASVKRVSVRSSLAVGEKPPSGTMWSHHRPAPIMATGFPNSKPVREIDREASSRSHGTLCNLIFEVTRHYFCHVLFIRIESKGPIHNQREGIAGDWNQKSRFQGFLIHAPD